MNYVKKFHPIFKDATYAEYTSSSRKYDSIDEAMTENFSYANFTGRVKEMWSIDPTPYNELTPEAKKDAISNTVSNYNLNPYNKITATSEMAKQALEKTNARFTYNGDNKLGERWVRSDYMDESKPDPHNYITKNFS